MGVYLYVSIHDSEAAISRIVVAIRFFAHLNHVFEPVSHLNRH